MTWLDHVWAVALVVLLIPPVIRRFLPQSGDASPASATPPAPDTQRLTITGMTCSHCSATVERGLREVPGVQEVVVDLRGGAAEVRGAGVDADALTAAVEGLGFGVKPAADATTAPALQSGV